MEQALRESSPEMGAPCVKSSCHCSVIADMMAPSAAAAANKVSTIHSDRLCHMARWRWPPRKGTTKGSASTATRKTSTNNSGISEKPVWR
eukprot:3771481-Alexandrium_andersonii.AAC.1